MTVLRLISLFIFFTAYCSAQQKDSVIRWADRLLDNEVVHPVVFKFSSKKDLASPAVLNRLLEAELISLDFESVKQTLALLAKKKELPIPERVRYEINKAHFQFEMGDYPHAAVTLHQSAAALGSLPKGPDASRLRRKATLLLGRVYLQMGKLKEAKSYLDSSLHVYQRDSTSYTIKLAQTYYSEGLWAKKSNRLPEAISYYQRAIALFESSENPRYNDLGKCYNNLAGAYDESGNYRDAKEFYLKALEIKKKFGADSLSLAITNNNLGRFYFGFGDFTTGKEYFRQSLAYLNERNPRHRERLAELLKNYAALLLENEEAAQAEEHFNRALALSADQPGNSGNRLLLDLGLAASKIMGNDLEGGKKMLERIKLSISDSSSKIIQAKWFLLQGNILARQGELPQAERSYSKALSLEALPATDVAALYLNLGLVRVSLKQYPDGILMMSSAIREIKALQSPHLLMAVTAYNLMGESYSRLHQPDSAIRYLNLAIRENVLTNSAGQNSRALYPFELISSCYLLSKVYQSQFHRTNNLRDLNRSAESIEMGLHAIDAKRKDLSTTNDQLQFDEKIADFFSQASDVFYEQSLAVKSSQSLEKLFYVSELSKSQSLGSLLRKSNLHSFADIPALLQERERRLGEELQNYDLQLLRETGYAENANRDLLQEYKVKCDRAARSYRQLQDSLREKLPGYYQFKYNKTLVGLREVQHDLLDDHKALLQFTLGDSVGVCHVVLADTQFVYRIPGAHRLRPMVLALRNQIKVKMDEALAENASRLYAQVMAPAISFFKENRLPIDQLIVVPDQILCYLPFETLMTEKKKDHFLLFDYSISYALSATLFWQKETEKSNLRKRTFVGLAPEFKTADRSEAADATRAEASAFDQFQFQPLTGNRIEVNSIKKELDKKNIDSRVLQGGDATESSFRQLNLGQYDYIHFATHGFVDMDYPQLSGIAFSRATAATHDDDILYTNEIYNMHLNAQLVCISSCDSGLGRLYRGEGIVGLARAFFYAGARNLTVSLWKVDDTATSDLMVSFYNKIFRAKNLSTALTDAKRKMASSKKFSQPYYWAPFILIGE
jgi:CHAT domain-containing protein/tetratricopeptide (TPR) repeat protein